MFASRWQSWTTTQSTACLLAAGVLTWINPGTASADTLIRNEWVKLLPVGGGEREGFGTSVAIEGDTAVIGAGGTGVPEVTGSVYVLTRDAHGVWTQRVKFVARDGPVNNFFGESVALSGDTFVVGAPFDDDEGEGSGSVYVYRRNGQGVWSFETKIIPSGAAQGTRIGQGVALHGDVAAISSTGTIYVFRRTAPGIWTEEDELAASDGAWLGPAVGIEDETVVAGAPSDSANGEESGAAYVFRRNASGQWFQEAKVTPADAAEQNLFGASIAMHGGRFAVGANDFNYPFPGLTGGKAYVYARNGQGNWVENQLPTPSDNEVGDQLGRSIAIHGDTVVVGQAPHGSEGSAYVYTVDQAGAWSEQVKLMPDDPDADGVGFSVAVHDGTALAGARFNFDMGQYAGATFVFSTLILPGDFNNDGMMTLADYQAFSACLTGPEAGPLQPDCETADLDGDGDADLRDYGLLSIGFGN